MLALRYRHLFSYLGLGLLSITAHCHITVTRHCLFLLWLKDTLVDFNLEFLHAAVIKICAHVFVCT